MSVEQLLGRARGPLGPAAQVDFGVHHGPFAELAAMLTATNGFFAYNAGVQVFRIGDDPGAGYELMHWNSTELWKPSYQGIADDFFCFGQDLLGRQFAIRDDRVVTFDPEDATSTVLGASLDDWAAWLAADPAVNATNGLALAWQREHGALRPEQRLLPKRQVLLGGSLDFGNLRVSDAAQAMRARGPVAKQIHDAPEGSQLRIEVPE